MIQRAHQLRRPFAVAALSLAALACVPVADRMASADGGTDAPSEVDGGRDSSAASCAPDPTPRPTPPKPVARRRNECIGKTLIQDIVDCVFGVPRTAAETCDQQSGTPEWVRCKACLMGGAEGSDAGVPDGGTAAELVAVPMIVVDDVAILNRGACVELASPGDPCIPSYYQADQCLSAACVRCAPQGQAAYDDCRVRADESMSVCRAVSVVPSCGLDLTDAGCAPESDFRLAASKYGARFCTPQD